MKKVLFLLFMNAFCYSETKTIVETKNIYNGVSEEIVFSENDYEGIEKRIDYYNKNNTLMQIDVTPLELTRVETGIIKQEIHYYASGLRDLQF